MPPVYVHPDGNLTPLIDEVAAIQADLAALRTLFANHVHSGITAGAANSAAPTVAPAALTSIGVTRK